MQTLHLKNSIHQRKNVRLLYQIILLGTIFLLIASCSNRGVLLRNKSIKEWEKMEQQQAEEKSKLDSSAVKIQFLKTEDHE